MVLLGMPCVVLLEINFFIMRHVKTLPIFFLEFFTIPIKFAMVFTKLIQSLNFRMSALDLKVD